ncbi:MAG TPA: response regulator [Vicinamibacterales bacterium]|jgi:signal transduction histidine kinase|nr:response regulator [Vicinamibacterales bacterium]
MKTALIVDDHEENRYLLRTVLTAAGYQVQEASNGADALNEARNRPPTIIISDILMPQMDGFAFCRECSRDSVLAKIPFVFYTATYTSPADEALAAKLGAARFITKPVSDDEFVAAISAIVDAQASGRLAPRPAPPEDETVYYRLYNEVLIHKLEDKVLELEQQIGERLRAEEEREQLQAQLIQAQKVDAVGRLAGGIAHDFNNVLSVIIGFAELALDTSANEAVRDDLVAICDAAKRGAEIVRQLLAFARKQTASPVAINPNASIVSLNKMIGRLLGDNIKITTTFEPAVWPIRIDPTHFDQIVINLLTNARDAMEGEGTITIRTSNLTMDDEYVRRHPGARAGDYVALEVADRGTGMDATTRERLFEPFFTTKTQQFGTGLGLSTVLGIVERSGGHIDVHSVLGEGTTFTIYLPRDCEPASEPAVERTRDARPADATVLVVEDNPTVLALVKRTLESRNYRVLSATGADEATRIGNREPGRIDLVLADTAMPQMTGKALVDRLREEHPDIKALYSCGYRADLVMKEGSDGAEEYIQKPFTPHALADRIRRILHP